MASETVVPADLGEKAGEASGSARTPVPVPAAVTADPVRRWSAWPGIALERLPLPYALTVGLLTLLSLGEQVLEYSLERAAVGGAPAISLLRLAAFPILVAYVLSQFYFQKRATVKALTELRPTVLVGDEEYEHHARHMVAVSLRVELALLAASVVVVLALFVGLRADLLNTNYGLPASPPAAAYIFIMYVLLGWLLLAVVYSSLRQGKALYELAHRPLVVNAFDPAGLVPFGRLGLIQSLPIVGIVLVPLILFGAPTKGGYVVIVLSAVSVLALFVPLWGVHRQIDQTHKRVLTAISEQLQEIQDSMLKGTAVDAPSLAMLSSRTAILSQLRKTIQEAPNWPFRGTAGLTRAVVAATSPLVYFTLNELIRAYVLPILSR